MSEVCSLFVQNTVIGFLFGEFEMTNFAPKGAFGYNFLDVESYIKWATRQTHRLTHKHLAAYLPANLSIEDYYYKVTEMQENKELLFSLNQELRSIFPFLGAVKRAEKIADNYLKLLELVHDDGVKFLDETEEEESEESNEKVIVTFEQNAVEEPESRADSDQTDEPVESEKVHIKNSTRSFPVLFDSLAESERELREQGVSAGIANANVSPIEKLRAQLELHQIGKLGYEKYTRAMLIDWVNELGMVGYSRTITRARLAALLRAHQSSVAKNEI